MIYNDMIYNDKFNTVIVKKNSWLKAIVNL